jgi:hypothetical protein
MTPTNPVTEPLHSILASELPDQHSPNTYVLYSGANISRKRLDWTTRIEIAGAIVIILGLLCLYNNSTLYH